MISKYDTEQDRTQAALFRLMADRIPGVVWSVDTNLRFTSSLGAGLEALGLHPDEVVGRSLFEYFQTDDEEFPVIVAHRRALSGESVDFEESWLDRIYHVHIERLTDGDDQVVGCIGFAHDVTQQSQARLELHRSEAKWRSVVENAPSFVVLVDRDGILQYLNRAQPGMTVEESIGQSVYDFTQPEYHEQMRESLKLVFEQRESSSFESVVAGPHGKPVWYETRVGPVMMDDHVVSATLIAWEITDRKRAEDRLRQAHSELERKVDERTAELRKANEASRESRDELQAIFDGVVDGLMIVDNQRLKAVQTNSAMCCMLGYSEAELRSVPVAELHPPDQAAAALDRFRAHASGLVSRSDEIPLLRKDGTVFYADVTTSPIIYAGRPCLLGFFRDVTERRQAEAALRRETQTQRRLLLASDHERQVIAYDIHDTLAQWIAGATMQFETYERLKEGNPSRAAEAFREGMDVLRQSQQQARHLIRGVRPITLDQMGVVGVITHFVEGFDGRQEPRIELHTDVHFDRLEPIQENSIYRIVQEALRNACRHSRSERVRIEIIQRDDQLQIVVQDWGIGFDMQEIGEYQFGLDGIRVRTRLLGGQAEIESEPGSGTRITVSIPIVERRGDE